MALTFHSGFEGGNTFEWSGVTGTPSIQSTIKKTGSYAMRANTSATTANVSANLTVAPVQFSVYVRVDTLPASDTMIVGSGLDANGAYIYLTSTGYLKLQDGSTPTLRGTSATQLSTGQFYRISGTLDTTNDKGYVWIDGVIDSNLNGVAIGSTIAYWGSGGLGNTMYFGVVTSATTDLYMDDVAVGDTSGSADLGDIRTLLSLPNAAGDLTGFDTPVGSATHWQNVDDAAGSISDADYNQHAASSAAADLYGIQDSATAGLAAGDTINAVHTLYRMRKSGSGSAAVHQSSIKDNGTTYETTRSVTTSFAWYKRYDAVMPNGGAVWTQARFDALQVGARHADTGGLNTDISALMVMVAFTPVGLTAVGDTVQGVWAVRLAQGDTVRPLWNVRYAWGDVVRPVWGVKVTVGDTVKPVWAVRKVLGDTVRTIWNVAALLQVGDTMRAIWNVRLTLGDTLNARWNTRKTLGDTVRVVWNVRITAGDTVRAVWNIRYALGDTVRPVWNTRLALGDTARLVWNARRTLGDTLNAKWGVRLALGDTVKAVWNVLANLQVGDTVKLVWNVRQAVGDTVRPVWNVRKTLGDTVRAIWNARLAVGDTVRPIWGVRQAVGDTIRPIWKVLANLSVGDTVRVIWNVRLTIGDTVKPVWNVKRTLGDTVQAIWNVRLKVGDTVTATWNVRLTAGDTVRAVWNARRAVGDTIRPVWNVRLALGNTVRAVFNVRGLASKSIRPVWNVKKTLGDTIRTVWNVAANLSVGDTVKLAWNVRQAVFDTLRAVWDVAVTAAPEAPVIPAVPVRAPSALPQPVIYRDFIVVWLPMPQTVINDRVVRRIDQAEKTFLPLPVSQISDRMTCREAVVTRMALPTTAIIDRLHSRWVVTIILPAVKSEVAERFRFGEKRRRLIREYDKLLGVDE